MGGVGRFLLAFALLATQPFALAQKAPDLGRAEGLIAGGKADEAYRLLAPFEFEFAGREDFDYLLGVAALDSGQADRATLIFERVLAVNPNHAAARLDMGRAYYALGDFERARAEFQSVLAFGPPPAARATVRRYLDAIEERSRPRRLRIAGYLEGALGYDSNVSNSTAQGSLFVPLFGVNFALAPTSTRQSGEFAQLGGGVDLAWGLNERWSLLAGADARQRANRDLDVFDNRNLDWRIGVQHASERDTVRVLAGRGEYDLDGHHYRGTGNLNAEWRRVLDARTQVSAYLQDSRIRYVQSSSRANSSDLFLYGAGGARTLDEASRSVLFGSVFRGDERATDGRSDGDRRLWGVRAGWQRALRAEADWYASASLQKSTYEQFNPIFLELRQDTQLDLALGVNWQFGQNWSARPQLTYTRNDSRIALNDYGRYEFAVTLRRDFR